MSFPGTADAARHRLLRLCGVARLRDAEDLIAGYRHGMFALSHIGPLKWWAPRYRMVLFFDQARVEKTSRRLLRNGKFSVSTRRSTTSFVPARRRARAQRR
jgi:leucyl/phenylalanyl-tRNA---protein transferase